MYAFISDEFATESLTQPSSHSKEQQLKLRDKLHGKFWSIEFIETWLARAIEISSKRVGSHVCQLSLLTIPIIPYSLPKISTSKNPYTDTRDAELGTILMQVLCQWDVVLHLEYRAFEVVDWCIDIGKWVLFGQVYRRLNYWSDSLDWPNPSIHCLQKMTILLYLYKWRNVQRSWDRCRVPALYAWKEWYDTPREMSSMFFRDSLRHDDNGD